MSPAVTITPVSPVLGAEITGIDLAAGIDDAAFATIHQAFLDHGVLFFRNQSRLDPSAQVAFAQRFGPVHEHPAAPTSDADAAVFVIHAHKDSPVANGNGWHTEATPCSRAWKRPTPRFPQTCNADSSA